MNGYETEHQLLSSTTFDGENGCSGRQRKAASNAFLASLGLFKTGRPHALAGGHYLSSTKTQATNRRRNSVGSVSVDKE